MIASSTAMLGRPEVDPGPFTCPVCRTVSFEKDNVLHGFCLTCRKVTAIPFDGPGTKVLVVGDAGGDLEWLTYNVIPYAKATGCHAIMQLGDFGLIWHQESANRNLDELHEQLDAAGLTLAFLPGNHEHHPLLERLASEAPRNSDGHAVLRPTIAYTGRISAWTWDGVRMAAIGGAPSIDRYGRIPGKSWWPEEMLTPKEVEAASQLGPVDIVFSHDAPAGVPMNLIFDLDSTAHRQYISQIGQALTPAYWYHGHYHESLFYRFHHVRGAATVRGLGCNHSECDTDSMVPINLRSIREGLDTARYRPEVV